MKKSLVITTIATVLVIVVALTTATFAWFSTSDSTTAKGIFTVSSGNTDFRIYTYSKTSGQYSVDPTYLLDLVTYGGEYNFTSGEMGGTLSVDSKINPTMPIGQLDGILANVTSGGLSAVNFMAGNQIATGVNVTSITSKPVYAKFLLDTGLADTQLNITVTISSDSPTRNMIYAINNLNFMLVGKSAVDSADTKSFVFGTTYSYYEDGTYSPAQGSGTTLALGDVTQAEYDAEVVTESVAEYSSRVLNGVTNVVTKDIKADLAAVTLTSFRTGNVQNITDSLSYNSGAIDMELGTEIECVLFVWFDGDEMTESASDGNFTFEISFAEVA